MPFTILHIAACLCLTAASLFWLLKHERKENAHQFLFPFILAAGILGSVLLYLRVMELFIVDYSGALYETDGASPPGHGLHRTILQASLGLLCLPLAGIFPGVGRRPLLMGGIGLLAIIPTLL